MTGPVLTICNSCDGFAAYTAPLQKALADAKLAVSIKHTECMSGCTRQATFAVRQSGKTAYLFGEIGPQDIPYIIQFLHLYLDAPDGNLTDARAIGPLRFKAIARIPG